MAQSNGSSLWDRVNAAGALSGRALWGAGASVSLDDLVHGSSLGVRPEELRGRSILVATKDHLTAALALIELDGIARRLVLCPSDVPLEQFPFIMATAALDTLVSDRIGPDGDARWAASVVACSSRLAPAAPDRSPSHETEWVLLTSGTTGLPKLVLHSLSSLTAPFKGVNKPPGPFVWSTFYDTRRYGGLQILLRALVGGGSLVLTSPGEAVGDFLTRAAAHGVTHISGTPSHWRRAVVSPAARRISPQNVRLSGEIADQAILDDLRAVYPDARIAHAFASTEAGVAFEVGDGLAGFPAELIGRRGVDVEMTVEDGSLRVRSTCIATRYLGDQVKAIADGAGFVDTSDMVERRGGRYYFVGRRDGVINVGGLKVHPEEVEAVINHHPGVRMSLVKARKNPFTGAIVVADVVASAGPEPGAGPEALKKEILEACRRALAAHKVPAAIRFVPSLDVGTSGKLARINA
jgi:acyl-coenzyme A synthetase/AMP-(fatty) acid ligase